MRPSDACFRSWVGRQFTETSVALFVPALLLAQQDRIAGPIENGNRVALKGNINPNAQPQFDRGPVDPSLKLNLVTLALMPTPQQQADLEQLLS